MLQTTIAWDTPPAGAQIDEVLIERQNGTTGTAFHPVGSVDPSLNQAVVEDAMGTGVSRYRIKFVNGAGESPASDEIVVDTDVVPPKPTGLRIVQTVFV